jgi:hypothetical protein
MTLRHRIASPRTLAAVLVTAITLWAALLFAYPDGVTGVSRASDGCSCHNSSPNASGPVTVAITGPATVLPGSTTSYTISVSGSPTGSTGGINLTADNGTLVAGSGTDVVGGEVVSIDDARRSWTFSWHAPATEGTYKFYAVGEATNGSGRGGDSWNWYGGAVSTPFNIVVGTNTPTARRSWGGLKARFR